MSTCPRQGTRKRGAGFTPSQAPPASSPHTSSLFRAVSFDFGRWCRDGVRG